MTVKLVKVDSQYTYSWPDGSTEVYKAVIYNVVFSGQSREVLIGFTEREAYGAIRRRVVVFVDGHPEAEFCGTDDYDVTGRLVAIVRGPDRKLMDIDKISVEYVGLPVVEHSTVIARGRKGKAGLVVTECDHDLMIRHALIQSEWRRVRGREHKAPAGYEAGEFEG